MKRLLDDCLDLAFKYHKKQYRKSFNGLIPYISHPIEVYKTLVTAGITDENILCAALLHDVIEECRGNESEESLAQKIQEELHFNMCKAYDKDIVSVMGMVSALTYNKELCTKEQYIKGFKTASEPVFLIKCADRICNVRDFKLTDEAYANKYKRKANVLWRRLENMRHQDSEYRDVAINLFCCYDML